MTDMLEMGWDGKGCLGPENRKWRMENGKHTLLVRMYVLGRGGELLRIWHCCNREMGNAIGWFYKNAYIEAYIEI